MELIESLERAERYAEVAIHRTFRDRTCPYDTLSDVEFRKEIKIHWPNERESADIRRAFYRRYRLPGIVGVIDGTLCRIQRPTEAEEDYVCRKGYHSLNVGVIVDHEMKIRWVCSRWPGSAHDSRVFKTSAIYGQLQRRQLRGVLLGDSAYASETFLLKPVNNPRNEQGIA
ncbi:hypothetical protein COOONC_25490 [Cooperia oncophora]